MIAATVLAILLIPSFFVVTQTMREWIHGAPAEQHPDSVEGTPPTVPE